MSSPHLDWALAYARWGFRVIPLWSAIEGHCECLKEEACDHPGKHPRLSGWQNKATSDPKVVEQWWKRWPHANVGIVTGEASKIFVLDVDDRNGGGDSLFELQKQVGKLDESLIVLTGGGGRHLYFRHPGFEVIGSKNGTGALDGFPGLDIQGEGNLVVAPPSLHVSGNRYEWEAAADPGEGAKITAAPAALLELLRPKAPIRRPSSGKSGGRGQEQAFELPGTIAEGGRNDTLFKYASSLRARHMSETEILTLVHVANRERCRPPLPEGDINQIVKSAARYAPGPSRPARSSDSTAAERVSAASDPETAVDVDEARDPEALAGGSGAQPVALAVVDGGGGKPPRKTSAKVKSERPPPDSLPLTHSGQAERLVAAYGEDMRYCNVFGKWLFWDAQRWIVDETGGARAYQYAVDVARQLHADAAGIRDKNTRDATRSHARRMENGPGVNATLAFAKLLPGIPVTPDELDANDDLFCVENGVLDLSEKDFDKILRAPRREDLITKMGGCIYDPTAVYDELDEWMLDSLGDLELMKFVQVAAGYTMTGHTREERFFFAQGPQGGGKGTLLYLLQGVFGDYAEVLRSESLMAKAVDDIPTDIAKLKGARIAIVDETEQQRRWNESLLKRITGNSGKITARFMRQDEFSYRPKFKLWIGGNHRPKFINFDGIERRINLIPYTNPVDPDKRDTRLKERLYEKALPALLAIMVRGARHWYEHGFPGSELVRKAGAQYREESDAVGRWIEEHCEVGKDFESTPSRLYKSYVRFAETTQDNKLNISLFGNELDAKGFKRLKSNGVRLVRGLRLTEEKTLAEKDAEEAAKREAKD